MLCKYPTTDLKRVLPLPNSDFLTPLFLYKEGFPLSLAYLFIPVYFYGFLTSPHHFGHFLTFWYQEIIQVHPVLSLCWTWSQPLPPPWSVAFRNQEQGTRYAHCFQCITASGLSQQVQGNTCVYSHIHLHVHTHLCTRRMLIG